MTLPADLAAAERVAGRPDARTRIGIGHDGHPFGPGEPLALGGIAIAGAPRLHGHSDGDVALHALADALLGRRAAGRPRPAVPGRTRGRHAGIASAELLAEVVGRLAAGRPGGRASIDLTIVGARPRLAAAGSTPCATRSPSSLGLPTDRGQRQGVERQPGRG